MSHRGIAKVGRSLKDLGDEDFRKQLFPGGVLTSGPSAENAAALIQTKTTFALLLKGVVWVPHYTMRKTFVGPGGVTLNEDVLRSIGAVEVQRNLWARP